MLSNVILNYEKKIKMAGTTMIVVTMTFLGTFLVEAAHTMYASVH